jgi:hypothetical protein
MCASECRTRYSSSAIFCCFAMCSTYRFALTRASLSVSGTRHLRRLSLWEAVIRKNKESFAPIYWGEGLLILRGSTQVAVVKDLSGVEQLHLITRANGRHPARFVLAKHKGSAKRFHRALTGGTRIAPVTALSPCQPRWRCAALCNRLRICACPAQNIPIFNCVQNCMHQ